MHDVHVLQQVTRALNSEQYPLIALSVWGTIFSSRIWTAIRNLRSTKLARFYRYDGEIVKVINGVFYLYFTFVLVQLVQAIIPLTIPRVMRGTLWLGIDANRAWDVLVFFLALGILVWMIVGVISAYCLITSKYDASKPDDKEKLPQARSYYISFLAERGIVSFDFMAVLASLAIGAIRVFHFTDMM